MTGLALDAAIGNPREMPPAMSGMWVMRPGYYLMLHQDASERYVATEENGSYDVFVGVTVTVTVPEGALSALRASPTEFAEELKRAAVAKWYELGTVSQGKGAEILGVSRAEFLDILSHYRVSPFQVDEEDFAVAARRG